MSPATFHLWIPNIFQFKGGIQTYSEFLMDALQNLYPTHRYQVFLKHDTHPERNTPCKAPTQFSCSGAVPPSLRTLAYATKLVGWGLYQRPELIISSHINFTLAAHRLKQIAGVPYWTVAHGVEAWDIENQALISALQQADLILAVSHYTRDRMLTWGHFDPERIVVLPNTFDIERFQPGPKPTYLLEKYHLKPSQPIILTVGRLAKGEQYKGHEQILDSLPHIRRTIPDVHYIIVGKGDDLPRIKQKITQMGLQDCVTLTGLVPDEELSDHYNLCDVFAMPSKGEGFGIVYLEALGCGKPVVGGNQDGAIDALAHGELGVLVNPDDIDEISQTLIQILQGNHPHQDIYQPEQLRQKVIETFGFQSFQATLSKHFQQHFPHHTPDSKQQKPVSVLSSSS